MTDKEKLERIKSLADKMSDTAFNITTDASMLRKAIDEYHQFIINEYHKEEPVSEELEIAANEWDAKASFTPFYMALDDNGNPNGVKQDYTTHAESFKAGAKWQIAKLMTNVIDAQCFGFQGAALFSFRLPADNYLVGSKVKVIVIKED
jgi:hypothetical protein